MEFDAERGRDRHQGAHVRELEERYEMLADHVQDLIGLHDIEGRFLYATPSARRLLGVEPSDLIGRSVYDMVVPEDVPSLREAHRDILGRSGKTPLTYRARHADGSIRWFETTARMTEPDNRGERRIVSVTRDITDRRALESRLMQSEKLEAIGRLAGGIAHDFNNLLTVITGQAHLALSQLLPDAPIATELDAIREAADRAAALTSQLLTFGKRQVTRSAVLDLNEAILGLHSLIRRLLPEDIAFETDLEQDLWPVRLDPAQLEQVLINLVVNARDAMPGGGRLRVSTRNIVAGSVTTELVEMQRSDFVALHVGDSGVGMDEETLRRAFEPFFSSKGDASGTGLGLPTVYGIIEQARGHVTLNSAPGLGTTASLWLPRTVPAADDAAHTPGASGARVHGSEKVLLVEDDSGVRALAQAVLERFGYRVVAAGSGQEALTLLRALNGDVDILVTDVIMPNMRGPTLAQHVHEMRPTLPVLYISGYAPDALARNGFDGKAMSELLMKPFRPEVLAGRVRTLLDASALRDGTTVRDEK
jgi:PAS domain S-box-containing protein